MELNLMLEKFSEEETETFMKLPKGSLEDPSNGAHITERISRFAMDSLI